MGRDGLLIGEVASRGGVSRKALRLYERTGILPATRRTEAGYRVYEPETLAILAFVAQARRLGLISTRSRRSSRSDGRAGARARTCLTLYVRDQPVAARQRSAITSSG